MFAIGLASRVEDTLFLLRPARLLLRSALAINVVMPLVAAAMAWTFDLPKAVEVALVALAVSPVPPLLPKKQIKAHGEPSYAIGLLVGAALVAVLFVPVAVELLGLAFQLPVSYESVADREARVRDRARAASGGHRGQKARADARGALCEADRADRQHRAHGSAFSPFS